MNSNLTKKTEARLPKGWIKNRSKSHKDRFYYFNTKTGETQWHPPAVPSSSSSPTNSESMEPEKNHSKRPPQMKRNPCKFIVV